MFLVGFDGSLITGSDQIALAHQTQMRYEALQSADLA
jgi:hypothetical protein